MIEPINPLARSIFGRDEVVQPILKGTTLVVVLGNKGYGYKPLKICLPHQVYSHQIEKWGEEGWKQIYVAPVGEPMLVAK